MTAKLQAKDITIIPNPVPLMAIPDARVSYVLKYLKQDIFPVANSRPEPTPPAIP